MSSDAIVLLKADHKEIRRLFREFEAAGDRAVREEAPRTPAQPSALKKTLDAVIS